MTGPQVVAWETTRRCALECRHCRGAARNEPYADELTTAEGMRLIDSLAACGKPLLILSGGEPMTRADIYDLARHAVERGLRVVLSPCGHLITDESARRIKESGIRALSISLDGPDPASHDAFRGVPGAFEASLRGLRCARAAGLAVQINTTVTRLNVDRLPALLELAGREGAGTLDLFFLVPTGRGKALANVALSAERAESALAWAAAVDPACRVKVKTTCAPQFARIAGGRNGAAALSRRHGCMAGREFVFVSHVGILQPCGFLEVPCGDLRKAGFDFKALYESSDTFQRLGRYGDYNVTCGSCEYLHACGGCRARAYAQNGDLLGTDPLCGRSRVGEPDTAATERLSAALQRGIPIARRPFAALAKDLGCREDDAMELVLRMLADGSARRFGAVFDARRLGYRSVLCAADVPEDDKVRVGMAVSTVAGVTHCYERGTPSEWAGSEGVANRLPLPNLWFTLAVPESEFEREVANLRRVAAPYELLLLPATRRFKIDVVFGSLERRHGEAFPGSDAEPESEAEATAVALTERERGLVRALQDQVPVCADPYERVAEEAGWTTAELLETLERWKRCGLLRRVALIVRHRRIGFKANAMCVWHVAEDRIVDAGRRVAEWPEVTHCYRRTPVKRFPFNLFAMIHAGDWESLRQLFDRLSESAGLSGGAMLGSLREFKKTSMRYFES